jgi:hypothetical protein
MIRPKPPSPCRASLHAIGENSVYEESVTEESDSDLVGKTLSSGLPGELPAA